MISAALTRSNDCAVSDIELCFYFFEEDYIVLELG